MNNMETNSNPQLNNAGKMPEKKSAKKVSRANEGTVKNMLKKLGSIVKAARKDVSKKQKFCTIETKMDMKLAQKLDAAGLGELAQEVAGISEKKPGGWASFRAGFASMTPARRFRMVAGGIMGSLLLFAGVAFLLVWYRGADIPILRNFAEEKSPAISLMKQQETEYGVNIEENELTIKVAENSQFRPLGIENKITIEPDVPIDIQLSDDHTTISVIPQENLQPGTEYKVTLRKGTMFSGGSSLKEDYTWTFRTEPTFAVVGITPRDGSTTAPANTTIEVEFNYKDIDPEVFKQYFQIEPAVTGTFELHGKKIVFLPGGQLATGTHYTVTVKAGFPNSRGDVLQSDTTSTFSISYWDSDGKYLSQPQMYWSESSPIFSVSRDLWMGMATSDITEPIQFKLYSTVPEAIVQAMKNFNGDLGKPDESLLTLVSEFSKTPEDARFFNIDFPDYGIYFIEATDAQYGRPMYKFVIFSPVGTIETRAMDSDKIWVFDMNNKVPVSGATVEYYNLDESENPIDTVTSDGNGYAVTDNGGIDLVIAEISGNYAITTTRSDYSYGWSWSAGWSGYLGDNLPYRAFIYTDRPLYRPGDEVRYKVILREENDFVFTLPGEKELTVRLGGSGYYWNNLQMLPIFEKSFTVSEDYGTVTGSFTLPSNVTPGYQSISAIVDGNVVGRNDFNIASYTKPRFNFEVSVDKPNAVNGEVVRVSVHGEDYSGNPAAGQTVQLLIGNAPLSQPNWFETSEDLEKARGNTSGSGGASIANTNLTMNANGDAIFDFIVDVNNLAEGIGNIHVNIFSLEAYNNFSRTDVLAAPTGVHIFAKPDKASVGVGDDVNVTFRSVTLWDLSRKAGVRINVSDVIRTWSEWVESGTYYDPITKEEKPLYKSMTHTESVLLDQELSTDSNGEVVLPLNDLEEGTYTIYTTYYNNANYGKKFNNIIYVHGESGGMSGDFQYPSERFKIYTDKNEYNVGNTAYINVKSRLVGKGILMIQRGDVYDWKLMDLDSGSVDLQEVMTNEMAPISKICVWGVDEYVSSFNASLGFEDEYLSNVFASYCKDITVNRDFGELTVSVTSDKETYGPGDEVTLNVSVKDSNGRGVISEVSLGVVDKALLDLSGDIGSYDVYYAFYERINQRLSSVSSMFRYVYLGAHGGAGGGGGGEGPRSDFPDAAYWNGAVETDRQGNATVTFTLPDNLTTWTTRAVAVSADTQVGEAQIEFVSHLDFSIDASKPKFLRDVDVWNMQLDLRNYSSQDVSGTLSVTCDGCTNGDFSKDVYIAAWSTGVESVELTPSLGTDSMHIVAGISSGGNVADSVAWDIPVIPEGFMQATTLSKLIADGEDGGSMEVTIPEGIDVNTSDLDLTLTRSFISGNELVPVDPTVSSSVDLSASMIHNSFFYKYYDQIQPGEAKETYQKKIQDAASLLYPNQASNGGFGWFDYDAVNYELSSYVGVALGMAVDSGAISAGAEINNLKAYLWSGLNSEDFSIDEKIFAIYALAQLDDHSVLPYAIWLKDDPSSYSTSPLDVAHLMLALQALDDMGDASELIPLLDATAVKSGRAATWQDADTEFRVVQSADYTTSVVYEALSKYSNTDLRELARNWLVDNPVNVSGNSVNAVQTFYSLAVANIENLEGSKGSNRVTLTVNGQEIRTFEVKGTDSHVGKVELLVPASALQNGVNTIQVTRDGDGDLYVVSNLTYYTAAPQGENEFTVRKSLRDFDTGAEITSVTKGQIVMVHTEVEVDRTAYNMVVKSFIPGGFEPVQYQIGQFNWEFMRKWWKWGTGDFVNRYGSVGLDHVTFSTYQVEAGKVYTFEYPVVATYTGQFAGAGSQGYLLDFEDIGGNSSMGTVVVAE